MLPPGVQIRKLYVAMIYTFSRFWWVRINPCAPKVRITFILHTNLHPVAKPSCKAGSRNIRPVFHILSFRLHAAPLKINLFHSLLGRRPPPPPGRRADERRTCAVERGNTAWHISIRSSIGCTLSLGPGFGVSSLLWLVEHRGLGTATRILVKTRSTRKHIEARFGFPLFWSARMGSCFWNASDAGEIVHLLASSEALNS